MHENGNIVEYLLSDFNDVQCFIKTLIKKPAKGRPSTKPELILVRGKGQKDRIVGVRKDLLKEDGDLEFLADTLDTAWGYDGIRFVPGERGCGVVVDSGDSDSGSGRVGLPYRWFYDDTPCLRDICDKWTLIKEGSQKVSAEFNERIAQEPVVGLVSNGSSYLLLSDDALEILEGEIIFCEKIHDDWGYLTEKGSAFSKGTGIEYNGRCRNESIPEPELRGLVRHLRSKILREELKTPKSIKVVL